MVYQLVYVSASSPSFSEQEITKILDTSRRNNAAAGITGILLTHDGSFFQVLEGPESSVTNCYNRIARDPRHKSPIILMKKQAGQRAFPRWSMGHATPDELSDEHRDILVNLSSLIGDFNTLRKDDTIEISILAETFVRSFREFAAA